MFVDKTKNEFKAGKGGNGCVSFRREKFVPKGGPDGGNGGPGGSIILLSQKSTKSLADLKYKHIIKAENGKSGTGSNKHGRTGKNKIIRVPIGTVIKSYPDEKILFDFTSENQELTIAHGGKGGWGNTHFKTSTNQIPRRATPGLEGETIKVIIELKLIAFAGLLGLPNAGKSTLISKISKAKPKIASYPFTTLYPNLGVIYQGYKSCVIADIPGIIPNAHKGEGMGIDFLKHIERTKLLIYLIDISLETYNSPIQTFKILQNELSLYKKALLNKRFFVVLNKMDLKLKDNQIMQEFMDYCESNKIFYLQISALKKTNLNRLINNIFKYINE